MPPRICSHEDELKCVKYYRSYRYYNEKIGTVKSRDKKHLIIEADEKTSEAALASEEVKHPHLQEVDCLPR